MENVLIDISGFFPCFSENTSCYTLSTMMSELNSKIQKLKKNIIHKKTTPVTCFSMEEK